MKDGFPPFEGVLNEKLNNRPRSPWFARALAVIE